MKHPATYPNERMEPASAGFVSAWGAIACPKYEEFDSARFNKLLKEAAFWQAISFLNANAKVAAKQNARLWWELFSTTEKVKQVTLPGLRVDTKKLQLLRNLI